MEDLAEPALGIRWELGVVFAQMLFGLDVTRRYGSPAELIREGALLSQIAVSS